MLGKKKKKNIEDIKNINSLPKYSSGVVDNGINRSNINSNPRNLNPYANNNMPVNQNFNSQNNNSQFYGNNDNNSQPYGNYQNNQFDSRMNFNNNPNNNYNPYQNSPNQNNFNTYGYSNNQQADPRYLQSNIPQNASKQMPQNSNYSNPQSNIETNRTNDSMAYNSAFDHRESFEENQKAKYKPMHVEQDLEDGEVSQGTELKTERKIRKSNKHTILSHIYRIFVLLVAVGLIIYIGVVILDALGVIVI